MYKPCIEIAHESLLDHEALNTEAFIWHKTDNKAHQDRVGILKTHRRFPGEPLKKTYTEQSDQKTHISVNSAVNQNRWKVNFHQHCTQVTYQRSSVTQAWWWGWPPVRRERKYNLCVCKIEIEWACVCVWPWNTPWASSWRWTSSDIPQSLVCASWKPQ